MKKLLVASVVSAAILGSFSASANDTYFGASVNFLDIGSDGDDVSINTLVGTLGKNVNENLSAEFRFGFGLSSDSVDVFGTEVDIDLNNMYGVYLKGKLPMSDSFVPYAVIGYSRGELEASAMGISASESESDVSFGFGFDYKTSESFSVNFEYINYLDKDGTEVDGFGIGFAKSF